MALAAKHPGGVVLLLSLHEAAVLETVLVTISKAIVREALLVSPELQRADENQQAISCVWWVLDDVNHEKSVVCRCEQDWRVTRRYVNPKEAWIEQPTVSVPPGHRYIELEDEEEV